MFIKFYMLQTEFYFLSLVIYLAVHGRALIPLISDCPFKPDTYLIKSSLLSERDHNPKHSFEFETVKYVSLEWLKPYASPPIPPSATWRINKHLPPLVKQ